MANRGLLAFLIVATCVFNLLGSLFDIFFIWIPAVIVCIVACIIGLITCYQNTAKMWLVTMILIAVTFFFCMYGLGVLIVLAFACGDSSNLDCVWALVIPFLIVAILSIPLNIVLMVLIKKHRNQVMPAQQPQQIFYAGNVNASYY